MWSIVWNIDGVQKKDEQSFRSSEQARTYAKYYHRVLEKHYLTGIISKRFSLEGPLKKPLKIEYRLIHSSPKSERHEQEFISL
jgi:hypothetical protein